MACVYLEKNISHDQHILPLVRCRFKQGEVNGKYLQWLTGKKGALVSLYLRLDSFGQYTMLAVLTVLFYFCSHPCPLTSLSCQIVQ